MKALPVLGGARLERETAVTIKEAVIRVEMVGRPTSPAACVQFTYTKDGYFLVVSHIAIASLISKSFNVGAMDFPYQRKSETRPP